MPSLSGRHRQAVVARPLLSSGSHQEVTKLLCCLSLGLKDFSIALLKVYAKLSTPILYDIRFAECMCTVQQKEHDCACCDGPLDFVNHHRNEFDTKYEIPLFF